MFQSSIALEIQSQYESGNRSFQNCQLRNADLRGLNLSNANFQGVDLSGANLRDADLSGANLQDAYLNEADLTGANLQGANLQDASLIKTYLNKANLQNVNLERAYLTGVYATKANLQGANLKGSYLNGAKLSGAILTGAMYDHATHFDVSFDPLKTDMKKETSATPVFVEKSTRIEKSVLPPIAASAVHQEERVITIADLLVMFNHLSEVGCHYLGSTIIVRHWDSTRPNFEWLQQFKVNRAAQITFEGDDLMVISSLQLQWAREWVKAFAKVCTQIVQDYPKLIDRSKLVFAIAAPPRAVSTVPVSAPQANTYSEYRVSKEHPLNLTPVQN